ncbi:MAG: filamentous hemagglutinin N-terminal domain-containing protein, partial [Gammaproteobacteria bacterium]
MVAGVTAWACAQCAMAQPALPTNGSVTRGSATINTTAATMTVNQTSQRAVIDWGSFDIGSGASVAFTQPATTSVAVNRVGPGAGQSVIDGALTANGHVMIHNPDGVAFTSGAAVNVAGLIASTGNIDVDAVMSSPSAPIAITEATSGSVANEGSITVTDAGLAAFVAPSVVNDGTIAAASGRVVLAGAQTATVSLNGGLYELVVDRAATNGSVTNTGALQASGGSILLSAEDASSLVSGVINLTGVQQADRIEVNGDQVVLGSDLDAGAVGGRSGLIEVGASAQIQDGIDISKTAGPGATVNVRAGSYFEQVTLNKPNLALIGEARAKIVVPDGPGVNGLTVSADNVTVSGFEIAGPVTSSYLTYPWGSNITRGIVVKRGADGFTLANNDVHDIRTGILIDGRDDAGTGTVVGSVTGNIIENTKSGISVQYTDGSDVAITGNVGGPIGNEWGVNLHLNGFLDGGSLHSNPHLAAPSPAWQQSLLDLSAANGGWAVQDQGYSSSNRTHVHVATSGSDANQGSLLTPRATIRSAIDAVVPGGTVDIAAGTYVQSSTLNVNKSVMLTGSAETQTIIDARSVTGYGMSVSADDVTLSDFTLYGPSAFVASAYGIKVSPGGVPSSRLSDFTIRNVTSRGAGKAELDLNGVDGATIDHVSADGAPVGDDVGATQGAGIQLTDSANVSVTNSSTRGNAWGGIAIYQANRSYDQQAHDITIAANNTLGETNPLYLQDESTLWGFGTLN